MFIAGALFFACAVFLIDFIARRKRWKENTRGEKTGLILTLLFSFPYVFCSVYGALFGLAGTYGQGPYQKIIHTIVVAGGIGVVFVCLASTAASLVLRKRGNAKASNRALLIGFVYCILVTAASLIFG